MQQQQLEFTTDQWFSRIRHNWMQGEHICIIGPTGSGKTTIAQRLLAVRQYVVVFGVKQYDETLELFSRGKPRYKLITKWPPEPYEHRVILWTKPKGLKGIAQQGEVMRVALNKMYESGGWCIFFDDAGYISGYLHMGQEIGVLLNQGRSSHISVVVAMTQPKSVVAKIPSESFKQCRHSLIFKYDNLVEIKAIAEITGVYWRDMVQLMQRLDKHDFLYKSQDRIVIVRNTTGAV